MHRCKITKEEYPDYIQREQSMCTPITERGKIYQTVAHKGHVYIVYHGKLRKLCCNGSTFKWHEYEIKEDE